MAKILTCPICGTFKVGVQRKVKTCSPECGQILLTRTRGAKWRSEIGKMGHRASTPGRVARQNAKWAPVPFKLAKAIHRQGYDTGFSTGQRSGFAKGYDQALRDMGVGTQMRLEEYRRQQRTA
jgi:hypothetical protein